MRAASTSPNQAIDASSNQSESHKRRSRNYAAAQRKRHQTVRQSGRDGDSREDRNHPEANLDHPVSIFLTL
jgi:hypothetical protein